MKQHWERVEFSKGDNMQAWWEEDRCWFRARVLETHTDKSTTVLFLDWCKRLVLSSLFLCELFISQHSISETEQMRVLHSSSALFRTNTKYTTKL
jgi:hypothetical protein